MQAMCQNEYSQCDRHNEVHHHTKQALKQFDESREKLDFSGQSNCANALDEVVGLQPREYPVFGKNKMIGVITHKTDLLSDEMKKKGLSIDHLILKR